MAASAEKDGYPPSFICPLTLEVMSDPVTAADGHSYEAEAITKWFQTSNMSPLTGLPMQSRKLIPSHALRNAILEHHAAAKSPRASAGPSSSACAAAAATPPAATTAARPRPGGAGGGAGALKLILIGDSSVGKTSIVHRVKEGSFSVAPPTIGCSFCQHAIQLPGGGTLPVAIWDTAGAEKYKTFTRQYFRGASAVLVCYDITSADSFDGAKRWTRDVLAELCPPPVMALVGTKGDLEAQRKVPRDEASRYAAEQQMLNLECSAKEGRGVDATFEEVARAMQARGLASTRPGGGRQLRGAAAAGPQGGGCC